MSECRLIRGGEGFQGKQGLDYVSGTKAESVVARAILLEDAESS